MLVASRDEIRTFRLPGLVSGPLYRVLGDNVGLAPIEGSSFVLLAQSSRVALVDLSAPQARDGLVLSQEAAAPAPLTGMLTSSGDRGPIALGHDGLAWCVRIGALPPPPAVQAPLTEESTVEPTLVAPPLVDAAIAEPPPSSEAAAAPPGSVFGSLSGPSLADVAALVFLGPDNVLHEAARVVPDEHGRFAAQSLAPGSYRIVAAGKGGRVLICNPPFITIRVSANGAIAAPELKVLRTQ